MSVIIGIVETLAALGVAALFISFVVITAIDHYRGNPQ